MSDVTAVDASTLSPDDELDLSGAGLQEVTGIFEVVDAGYETGENGTQYAIVFEAEEEISGLPGNRITDKGYIDASGYPDPEKQAQMEQIGQGNLKRIFMAFFGLPKGAIGQLIGQRIQAHVSERNGFNRIGRFKAVS